jgi:hypothetical protein
VRPPKVWAGRMEEHATAAYVAAEEDGTESSRQPNGLDDASAAGDDQLMGDSSQGAAGGRHFETTEITALTNLNELNDNSSAASTVTDYNDNNAVDDSHGGSSASTSCGSDSCSSSSSEASESMGFSGIERFGNELENTPTQERAPRLEFSQSDRGRGGPGRGRTPVSGRGGLTSSLSGSNLPEKAQPAPARIPRAARQAGRGREGRGGGGRGRGLGPKSGTLTDVTDEFSAPKPSRMLARAASERFVFKTAKSKSNEDFPILNTERKAERSRSMNLSTDGSDQGIWSRAASSRFAISNLNRYSVAFGASREQHHYQPKVIRRSQKMDIQTGGVTAREVVCQRIIDYPEAMNPAERRRKTVVRRGSNRNARESTHGKLFQQPQYRIQCKVQTTSVSCFL